WPLPTSTPVVWPSLVPPRCCTCATFLRTAAPPVDVRSQRGEHQSAFS
ncbi:MAG: hypothetical protein AVDCRST_MAG85-2501, partial [uncultured Solirubrobacteraceae bacterium]